MFNINNQRLVDQLIGIPWIPETEYVLSRTKVSPLSVHIAWGQ